MALALDVHALLFVTK